MAGYRNWIDHVATIACREATSGAELSNRHERIQTLVDAIAEVYEKSEAQVRAAVTRARKAKEQAKHLASEPHVPYEESWADGEGQRDPDDDELLDFANPGSNSALRAATPRNPRNLPCPNCGTPNRLTPADKALGYQCDRCADRAEAGLDY
jgi:hypothetical protein